MKVNDFKTIFTVVGLIGILLIASPMGSFIRLSGQQFSILYLLGPDRTFESLPSNILIGENYLFYVNVANHMGSSMYYLLNVKVGSESDPLPDGTNGTPSSLMPVHDCKFFVPDNGVVERVFTFSISDATYGENQSTIESIAINNIPMELNKTTIWNPDVAMYSYKLLFELWVYSKATNTFSYDSRFVNLQFNLTASQVG